MIVIPMAGQSSRFFKAGYNVPKYQLKLRGESMFSWAVSSFREYFLSDPFIFIYRDIYNTKEFLEREIRKLGIKNYKLICLNSETLGQADTVYQATKDFLQDEELFIFNIDSKLLNFKKPDWIAQCDGYLEVFEGIGDHWSFVEPIGEMAVKRTTEKVRISNLCSNGLYYFKSVKEFNLLIKTALANKYFIKGELYIAPLYNLMIEKGKDIRYQLVKEKEILFCGTPHEYQTLFDLNE